MRCDAFEDRLNDLLDRRLRPEYDARLAAHARNCPRCGEMLSIQHRVIAELVGGASDPSPDLVRRIVRSLSPAAAPVRSSAQSSVGRRSRRQWALAAAAACVALAMIPAMQGWLSSPAPTAIATVAPPSPPSIVAAPDESSPPVALPQSILPPSDPVAGLVRGLGQSMARGIPGVTSAAGPIIDPGVLPGELAERLEPLRPLAAPMAAVVDLLWKSLPRLSDRPDARSSRVVDVRPSVI